MTRKFTPRPHQKPMLGWLYGNRRCCLFGKPGVGKTGVVLTFLADLYGIGGESRPTLVIGPKRVAQHVWSDEVTKWDHLAGLDVSVITGTEKARLAALRRDAPIYTINYEQLPWLAKQFDAANGRWPFGTVIADESSKLKSFRTRQGSVRARALARFAHKSVKRWINLTGTPAANGLQDLWGQLWFVDAGQRLGRTFSAFEDRYFRIVHRDAAFTKRVPADGAQELVQAAIADVCLTLDPRDWFDLREPVVNTITVDLPPAARRQYDDMEREMFVRLTTGEDVEAFNASALTMKCLQMASGAVYVGAKPADGWAAVHDAKLEALADLVDETGEPVLVAYHFVSDRERLLKRFPDALDLGTAEGMAAAKRGEGRVWLGHPASMGHGVDGLQHHCSTVAFFSHWWDFEQYEQIIERVGPMRQMQAGTNRPVFIHHIVARSTIDEVVSARRSGKRDVQDSLLNYLKAKQ